MIQKCLDDGHKPGTMVEIWVALEKGASVTVSRVLAVVADTSVNPPGTKTQWLSDAKFGDGDAIPSCTTCQVTLTEMVCKTGQPPCP